MVELKHITKIFNRNRPDEFTAIEDVSLLVEARKVTVFKGPSGSGKTTLLSIIGAMAKPTSGRVFVDGREITSLPERFLTEIRRRTFGFIFQQFHLIRGISALENVMLPAYTTGEKHAALRDRALHLLDLFGLSEKARSMVEWLSGGEAQRVAIARALVNNPAVIALLTGSLLVTLMVVYAAYWGWKIISGWDLQSGSEQQLALEKKTYLISTLMAYAFGFQILSFFLLIYVGDDLHRLFVGAMCAAGTLNVNEYGYPAVVLKVLNCVLGGVWLILNHTDNRAADYPLTRKKYSLLLAIVPFLLFETEQLWSYFLNLKANVITSCCGSLFSADEKGVAAGLAALPVIPMQAAFFGIMALTLASGMYFLLKGRRGKMFAVAGTLAFPVSIAALISFISVYFYEQPTHHCPFCILQGEYNYVGFLIYAALLGGGIASTGLWVLLSQRSALSLIEILPCIQGRLATASLFFYFLLTIEVLYKVIFSDFSLTGY